MTPSQSKRAHAVVTTNVFLQGTAGGPLERRRLRKVRMLVAMILLRLDIGWVGVDGQRHKFPSYLLWTMRPLPGGPASPVAPHLFHDSVGYHLGMFLVT